MFVSRLFAYDIVKVFHYYGSGLHSICVVIFFFQAEDGIRDLVRSRGLGDVYKRQAKENAPGDAPCEPELDGGFNDLRCQPGAEDRQ